MNLSRQRPALTSGHKWLTFGATDAEIKIGNTMAYSGPLSAYALIGKVEDAGLEALGKASILLEPDLRRRLELVGRVGEAAVPVRVVGREDDAV